MNIYGHAVPHLPIGLLAMLATSEARLWMYGSDAIHGVLRLLHLLGIGGFIGTVLVLNLKQLGLFAGAAPAQMRGPLLTVLEVSFWATVASGLMLLLYDPIGVGLHTMFLPKLLLVLIGFIAAKWPPQGARPPIRRGFAASSLGIWFLVMAASTWNHIEHPRNPADIYRMEHPETHMGGSR
jgi:hypothetical protein